jgi:hypothetical protein
MYNLLGVQNKSYPKDEADLRERIVGSRYFEEALEVDDVVGSRKVVIP